LQFNFQTIVNFIKFWQQRLGQSQWVIADQALVSGTNFLTGVVLARFLGVENYGKFVILYAVLLYANIIQSALILAPMLSIVPQINSTTERTKYFNGVLTFQLIFSFFTSIILFIVAYIISLCFSILYLQQSIFAISCSVFAFQLQDWLRRYFFINFKSKNVFFNDCISYGGQVFLLYVFNGLGRLNLAITFWIIFITSTVAFAIGIPFKDFSLSLTSARLTFVKSWKFGRNLLFSGQLNWARTQGILLLGGTALGTTAVGGIRAAQNIVGPLNIIFQGMENIIPIKASRQYYQRKLPGLINYLKKTSMVGGMLIALICISILIFSKQLIVFAYGQEYAAYAPLIICQSIIALMGYFTIQIFYFLRTIDNTQEIVWNTFLAFLMTFIFAVIFWNRFAELGIMLALIIGELAGLIHGFWSARKKCSLIQAQPDNDQ
jgi:O-antigen/teichoic acid export membrane protein